MGSMTRRAKRARERLMLDRAGFGGMAPPYCKWLLNQVVRGLRSITPPAEVRALRRYKTDSYFND